jgi:hypothetical protein
LHIYSDSANVSQVPEGIGASISVNSRHPRFSSGNLFRKAGVKANAMNYFKLAISLAILMSCACVANCQELPVITLRRTWCLGTCPIYSLEIFKDGRVHYNGEKFVAVIGTQDGQISPLAVEGLVKSFLKIDYFDLEDVYETHQNPDGT